MAIEFAKFLHSVGEVDPFISLDGEKDRRAGFPAILAGWAPVPDLFHRAEVWLRGQGRARVRLK